MDKNKTEPAPSSLYEKALSRIGSVNRRGTKAVCNAFADAATIVQNYCKPSAANRSLVILDHDFPVLTSSYRVTEYNAYLDRFPDSLVYSQRCTRENLDIFEKYYPQFKDRGLKFNRHIKLPFNLAYTLFLKSANNFIGTVEKNNLPFVFTLYPGGGFEMNQAQSDRQLRRICDYPNLKKIITTQKVTSDYLLEKKFCGPDKIEYIYGGVVPIDYLLSHAKPRKFYHRDKKTFDICFVARKYMPRGVNKGYDVFIEVAARLARMHPDINFHVVGNFDETDIDVSQFRDRITFYGLQPTEFFPDFYSGMDIILSPNTPFVWTTGGFDGFPTGCCIEAALSGVAFFGTDLLKQNTEFKDGEEVVVLTREPDEIAATVERYYKNYDALQQLAITGKAAFERVFALATQMQPRLKVLSEAIEEKTGK